MSKQSVDPRNGYCAATKTFHSLRPPAPLPPLSQPLSLTDYTFSVLQSNPNYNPSHPFLIDPSTDRTLSFSDLILSIKALSLSLKSRFPSLCKNDVAFILSPPSLEVPILYFSLLSLGVAVSPANPLSSPGELSHLLKLCKPVIAFATSSTSSKLPWIPPLGTVLLDSPLFRSMLIHPTADNSWVSRSEVYQSDVATILYSSGTTGRVKGVELTHRNVIAVLAGLYHNRFADDGVETGSEMVNHVSLFTLPLFHVFGFFMLMKVASMGEALVLMEKFDFQKMLAAVEKYKVTYMPVSPPLVVALAKSDLVRNYDLSSLQLLGCGGAPLGKEVSEQFKVRFPNTELIQGYGLTETGGGATRMIGPEEAKKYGSAGRLYESMEAKIVDTETGEALPPGQRGELWLRGPSVMKGYVGDGEATSATLDSDGWLKTGDLCYIDADGFLYIVDRLKELIKYKAYQVPPAELEHILQSHPDIADAAVIPYPDEEAGQIPMAYIVRKPGSSINEAQIMDFVSKQVAPYKKIRRVVFISSIPKSPAGKILRRELINHAISGASARL